MKLAAVVDAPDVVNHVHPSGIAEGGHAMPIDSFAGVLLISANAKSLRDFYVDVLQLPLEEESHEGVPLHYACNLGACHFAIHPDEGWVGKPTKNAQSPVILFNSDDAQACADRLRAAGADPRGPYDHGFAQVVSFRDLDGNLVEILQANR
jgi:catechol 2,3-dioxygenase-like lactoylglutathione lyase family enzyme